MEVCRKWDNIYKKHKSWSSIKKEHYTTFCDGLDNCVTCYEITITYKQLVRCIKWYNKIQKK
jgi:hypothetical protein